MKHIVKRISVLIILLLMGVSQSMAQCAMCRATIENNLSNGDVGIGANLNFGILYLFVMPYLAISIVGYLWYRNSKASANAKRKQIVRHV